VGDRNNIIHTLQFRAVDDIPGPGGTEAGQDVRWASELTTAAVENVSTCRKKRLKKSHQ
jgi:hypothetical protein